MADMRQSHDEDWGVGWVRELQVEEPEGARIQVQEQKLAFELFPATLSVRDAGTEAQGRKVTCSRYSIVAQLGLEHKFPASFHAGDNRDRSGVRAKFLDLLGQPRGVGRPRGAASCREGLGDCRLMESVSSFACQVHQTTHLCRLHQR